MDSDFYQNFNVVDLKKRLNIIIIKVAMQLFIHKSKHLSVGTKGCP
jgi:hypothetical protein